MSALSERLRSMHWTESSKSSQWFISTWGKQGWRGSFLATKGSSTIKRWAVNEISIVEVTPGTEEDGVDLWERELGRYIMPEFLDELCADMFDLSFTHKLVAINCEFDELYVERSANGDTNIDDTVMEAIGQMNQRILDVIYGGEKAYTRMVQEIK